jgi:hypothetical protein
MREDFESRQSTAVSAFSDASTNLASGMATITAQIALDRIQAETKQKQAAAANRVNYDTTPAAPSITVPSSTTLDGGSQINTDAGTLTLPGGKIIDLKTGLPKVSSTGLPAVNVTV